MLIDRDGARIGRFETSQVEWRIGDCLDLEDRQWRILEMLPEVSTAVAYLGVWVVEESETATVAA